MVFSLLTLTFAVAAGVLQLIQPPQAGLTAEFRPWIMVNTATNVFGALFVIGGVLATRPLWSSTTPLPYLLVFLLGLTAGALRVPLEHELLGIASNRALPWSMVTEAAWFLLAAFLARSVSQVAQRELDARASLVDAVERERATRSAMLHADAALRRDVAEWVHGAVQGELLRASLTARTLGPDGIALAEHLDAFRDGEVRLFAHSLHPIMAELDLQHALEQLAARFAEERSVELCIHADSSATERENRQRLQVHALPLYRIAEEALTNGVRHGDARNLWIDVHLQPMAIELNVRNDGRSPSVPLQPGLGSGIIDAWVRSRNGDWTLRFPSTGGADLRVTLPISTVEERTSSGAARVSLEPHAGP